MTLDQLKEETKKAIAEFNFNEENGFKLDKYGCTKEDLLTSDVYAITEMSKDKYEIMLNAYKLGYLKAMRNNTQGGNF